MFTFELLTCGFACNGFQVGLYGSIVLCDIHMLKSIFWGGCPDKHRESVASVHRALLMHQHVAQRHVQGSGQVVGERDC